MNSRERVVTAMRRSTPDRVPFDFGNGFAPEQVTRLKERTGQSDPNEFFHTDCRGFGISGSREHLDFSRYHPKLPPRAYIDEWGIGHLHTQSTEAGHLHLDGFLYPMACFGSAKDAEEYPLPDLEADYRYDDLRANVKAAQERGLAAVAHMECTIFEVAWYLRSMEHLLMDFIDNHAFAETLLDRITEKRVVQARRYAESGADIIRMGDDIASQRGLLMRDTMWRRWMKPRLARVIAAARAVRPDILVFYHTDGAATNLVPDFIDLGIDILNPIQPECMDPAALKREYGKSISFWGTVGTQTTLPFGTPHDVRREVQARVKTVGQGGGLFLAPTHMIEPDVPWQNILAFVEAVQEYGRYE